MAINVKELNNNRRKLRLILNKYITKDTDTKYTLFKIDEFWTEVPGCYHMTHSPNFLENFNSDDFMIDNNYFISPSPNSYFYYLFLGDLSVPRVKIYKSYLEDIEEFELVLKKRIIDYNDEIDTTPISFRLYTQPFVESHFRDIPKRYLFRVVFSNVPIAIQPEIIQLCKNLSDNDEVELKINKDNSLWKREEISLEFCTKYCYTF